MRVRPSSADGYVRKAGGCSEATVETGCNRPLAARIHRYEPDHSARTTMDPIFTKQIIVPLALFICITLAFKLLLEAITRYRMLKEGVSADLLAELLRYDEHQRRLSALRWGIFLVAIGLGFALIEAFGWTRPTPGTLALLAILTGIGQLIHYRLSKRVG
jgi:hypothetical protein